MDTDWMPHHRGLHAGEAISLLIALAKGNGVLKKKPIYLGHIVMKGTLAIQMAAKYAPVKEKFRLLRG